MDHLEPLEAIGAALQAAKDKGIEPRMRLQAWLILRRVPEPRLRKTCEQVAAMTPEQFEGWVNDRIERIRNSRA